MRRLIVSLAALSLLAIAAPANAKDDPLQQLQQALDKALGKKPAPPVASGPSGASGPTASGVSGPSGPVAPAVKKPTPEEQAAMEAWERSMTPGMNHRALGVFAGTWDAKVKSWEPGNPTPSESSGSMKTDWVLGNRWLEQRFESTLQGEPFSGIGYMGYDNVKAKYVGTWMDTMSTGAMRMEGKADTTGTKILYTGEMMDPVSGKPMMTRQELKIIDDDRHVWTMWGPDPAGKESKWMEIAYTRKRLIP